MQIVPSSKLRVNNQKTQDTNFTGKYMLIGSKENIAKAMDIIYLENKSQNIQMDFVNVGEIIVLTARDVLKKADFITDVDKLKKIASQIIVDSKDLVQKKILSFCPKQGRLMIYKVIKGDDAVFYSKEYNWLKQSVLPVNWLQFKSSVSLPEGIDKLKKIMNLKFNVGGQDLELLQLNDYFSKEKLDLFKKAISSNSKLNSNLMKGYLGNGYDSLALELNDNKVLKLATVKNYPDKLKHYDMPIYDKGVINIPDKNGGKKVFYYIQQKGENSSMTRITEDEMLKISQDIESDSGFPPIDMALRQLAKYNDQVYLVDPFVARRD